MVTNINVIILLFFYFLFKFVNVIVGLNSVVSRERIVNVFLFIYINWRYLASLGLLLTVSLQLILIMKSQWILLSNSIYIHKAFCRTNIK